MEVLCLEKQFSIYDATVKNRIETVMPAVMKETCIDMWLILAGEYNEDPIFKTIVPMIVDHASRLTCIVFSLDKDGNYEAVSINKPNASLAKLYKQMPYNTDTQWETVKEYIIQKNPKKIGVNISNISPIGAGLSHSLYCELKEALGEELSSRLVCADELSVRWVETRTEEELARYAAVYDITTSVMRRAFSREVITPGITTTMDVEFWVADQFRLMGLPTSFSPTVNLQRKGEKNSMIRGTIRPGDLLHYDAGIKYLGLCTDLQRLAYMLKPEEAAAPAGIIKGFETGRQFGFLAEKEFITGRTGNEIFDAVKASAAQNGIAAMMYSHPIGLFCHSAGPTIGLYDKQERIPGKGERKLYPNTAYALEYNVLCNVPEWEQDVYFYLEETVTFTEDGRLNYLDRAYKDLILI